MNTPSPIVGRPEVFTSAVVWFVQYHADGRAPTVHAELPLEAVLGVVPHAGDKFRLEGENMVCVETRIDYDSTLGSVLVVVVCEWVSTADPAEDVWLGLPM